MIKFRTEIDPVKSSFRIEYDRKVLLLGSCFTDEIGCRLSEDGFDVLANPLGPLYNPLIIARTLKRGLGSDIPYILLPGPRGMHCLDYASRFSGEQDELMKALTSDIGSIRDALIASPFVIITLGSAFVYEYEGKIVGNCHKFNQSLFARRLLSVDEIVDALKVPFRSLIDQGCRIVLTVSPIRHIGDGLHGNTLSKSTLHLACDRLTKELPGIEYFPAYEILLDDLRDYRFYAEDLKHPSRVAVDYIYDVFSKAYFSRSTLEKANEARQRFKASSHRPIL